MVEQKPITLTLTSWQQRMIKDHIQSTRRAPVLSKVKINFMDKKQWVMYRQPPVDALRAGAFNLYLTDTQIAKVSKALGVDAKVSALTISPDMIKSGALAFG